MSEIMPEENDFRRRTTLFQGPALAFGLALSGLVSGSAAASTILTVEQARTIELGPVDVYQQAVDSAFFLLPGESSVLTGGTATEQAQFVRFDRSLGLLLEVHWELVLRTGVSVDSAAVCVSETGGFLPNCTNDTRSVGAVTGSFGIFNGPSSSDQILFDFPISDSDFIQIDALIAATSLQSSTNTFGCLVVPDDCFGFSLTSDGSRERLNDDPSKYLDNGSGDISAGMSLGLTLFMDMQCSIGIGVTAICVTDSYAGANAVLDARLIYTYAVRTPPPPPGGGRGGGSGGDLGVVPLPVSGVLLLAGLGGLLAVRRRAARPACPSGSPNGLPAGRT